MGHFWWTGKVFFWWDVWNCIFQPGGFSPACAQQECLLGSAIFVRLVCPLCGHVLALWVAVPASSRVLTLGSLTHPRSWHLDICHGNSPDTGLALGKSCSLTYAKPISYLSPNTGQYSQFLPSCKALNNMASSFHNQEDLEQPRKFCCNDPILGVTLSFSYLFLFISILSLHFLALLGCKGQSWVPSVILSPLRQHITITAFRLLVFSLMPSAFLALDSCHTSFQSL